MARRKKNPEWGGAREGSGRKPLGEAKKEFKTITACVPIGLYEKAERRAKAEGFSLSKYIVQLLIKE